MKLTLLTMMLSAAAGLAQNGAGVPGPGNVALPLDEYNRLLEMAAKPAKAVEAPPVPYVIRSAQLNFAVQGELVSGSVTLEGEVFASGTVKTPLIAGMVVTGGELKGRDLPLTREGGAHQAILTGPGPIAITLQAALPLRIETGRASVQLIAPAAGAVRLSLSLPGEETLAHLSPGLITRRSSAGGRTLVEATLVPGQPASLWWAARLPPAPVAAPKETRFLSDVKTIVSLAESEVNCAALVEITVTQGEPAQFRAQLPTGFRYGEATGPTLQSASISGQTLTLAVASPAARSHQFLITMSKPAAGTTADAALATFPGGQRETGEVVVESEGAVEVKTTASGGLRRMDLKETSDALRAMARGALQAAFRYQRRPAESPMLALEWARFPETGVLSAAAQDAVVTTLVTSEGRSLTEVRLTVRNQSQQFLKVALPAGATILSAEVAGEKVKPVEGSDGSRVPLLRPQFRPPESYPVSFVFTQSGAPFVKNGSARFELPRMDVPVAVMQWEVFLPQQYRVFDFGGDTIAAHLMPLGPMWPAAVASGIVRPAPVAPGRPIPGQIGGIVTDASGVGVPKARVTVTPVGAGTIRSATTDANGRWSIDGVASGRVQVLVYASGFRTLDQTVDHDTVRGTSISAVLEVGAVAESVMVTAEAPQIQSSRRQNAASADLTASANVADLQRRVVGVLPIAINVPKAGNSYKFVRPLVVDETTRLTFRYRRK